MTDASAIQSGLTTATADVDQAILTLWPTVYRIARLILGDDDAAQDVAQDSCMRALQRRCQLRNPDAIAPWFRVLVSNSALTYRRQSKQRAQHEVDLSDDVALIAPEAFADVDLVAALSHLSDALRLPVVLHYYAGLSSAEIGKRLRLPAATVRYRLATARAILRPQLEDRR
jgi:RNA polymerase sigma factor (sigma-70 family)